eukprot:TRINITY_DN2219_c0_g1_i1.p1 TRINITY_DN2219_c0_g1~~TRINITY_DN2219_c0_g1_i1.p1  ORF type:complete len:437 (-),score=107.82 TRINITY_DN2219_c0_g1_i1:223-1533(-)
MNTINNNAINNNTSLTHAGDRFIPNRSLLNKEVSHFNLLQGQTGKIDSPTKAYKSSLSSSLFGGEEALEEYKVLSLKEKAPKAKMGLTNEMRVLYSQNDRPVTAAKSTRYIPKVAEKVLDAPGIVDDYYLNLVDWSDKNLLCVALSGSVYLWNASTSNVQSLVNFGDSNPVCSVSFAKGASSNYLAVGTTNNLVQLWDVEKGVQVREFRGHSGRVSSLAWNGHMLSSGSFDTSIMNHDVRVRDHHISSFNNHVGEVCGLKWSLDGKTLASGGNDNILNIWSPTQSNAKFTLTEHTAAVKALAWSPWQSNLLATGGGTADRCIKFWNTSTGECLNSIDTGSQVCSLQWSKHQKELLSSHGFARNQLCVWKYPSLTKVAEMTGHTARALHTAMSPDGTTVLSASPDETLRFWKVFSPQESESKSKVTGRDISAINRLR